jgi:hypothetical protein
VVPGRQPTKKRDQGGWGGSQREKDTARRRKPRTATSEEPAKRKSTDPPVHLLNPRPTHPPVEQKSLPFCFSTILGVSQYMIRGVQKHHKKCVYKKSMSKTFPMSVFPRFVWFYRVFGCFAAMGVQKHNNNRFAKKNVSKGFLQKKSTKNPKPIFCRFCLSRFWAFFGEGS